MRCALLHGFAGDPASWDEVIAAWQAPHEPFAIALPGHGGGPVQATWNVNLEAIALGDARVVVGYSLGARVALGLVATGRCDFGVLIGVNPGIPDAERAARRETDAKWAQLLRTEGIAAFADAWIAQPLFATQPRRADRQARRLARDPEQLARSLEVMGLAAMPDYRAEFPGDRVALLAGADDAKYVAIARALPAVSFEAIAGSGHDPTLEQPVALAAAIARSFGGKYRE